MKCVVKRTEEEIHIKDAYIEEVCILHGVTPNWIKDVIENEDYDGVIELECDQEDEERIW